MSAFLDNARSIFEAATGAARAGQSPSDLTILIGPLGIHMVAECDWPLESLLAHHGAQMVYRVEKRQGEVRVEGRTAAQSCRLEARTPAAAARRLFALGLLGHPAQRLLGQL